MKFTYNITCNNMENLPNAFYKEAQFFILVTFGGEIKLFKVLLQDKTFPQELSNLYRDIYPLIPNLNKADTIRIELVKAKVECEVNNIW